jgi:CHASE2 domain-containing sensor protein
MGRMETTLGRLRRVIAKVVPQGKSRRTGRRPISGFLRLGKERRRIGTSFAVGLIVLLLIQFPVVEQSFLGGPDREMTETAFKLRSDVIGGTADPVLFFDIDDRTLSRLSPAAFSIPVETTPRGLLADLLEFVRAAPAAQAPRAVLLDVDVAQPASDGPAGVARLQAALSDWAASPTAPVLVISRQSFPPSLFPTGGNVPVLPATPYDDIVRRAPNIFFATAKVLGDQSGVIREFVPYECVLTTAGVKPLYSDALIVYEFAERDQATLKNAPARRWVQRAETHCRTRPSAALIHGERIDYHISLDLSFSSRVWPDLDPRWPGFKSCDRADKAIFRRLSAIDILDALRAGAAISHDVLCQRIVLIGGTNGSEADFLQTPLSEMNGTVVLANAIRGLELTRGGLQPIPLIIQVMLLALVSVAFAASAVARESVRNRYHSLRGSPKKRRIEQWIGIILLSPLAVNAIIALAAHLAGVGLLLVTLNFGRWGFLSAPAFAVAITETIQDFLDD